MPPRPSSPAKNACTLSAITPPTPGTAASASGTPAIPEIASSETFVKRLIGMPGETIGAVGGHVYVCSGKGPADSTEPLTLPADPAEDGVPVGVRTVEAEGQTFEIWYPAADSAQPKSDGAPKSEGPAKPEGPPLDEPWKRPRRGKEGPGAGT